MTREQKEKILNDRSPNDKDTKWQKAKWKKIQNDKKAKMTKGQNDKISKTILNNQRPKWRNDKWQNINAYFFSKLSGGQVISNFVTFHKIKVAKHISDLCCQLVAETGSLFIIYFWMKTSQGELGTIISAW
jgi:hypothetical protein